MLPPSLLESGSEKAHTCLMTVICDNPETISKQGRIKGRVETLGDEIFFLLCLPHFIMCLYVTVIEIKSLFKLHQGFLENLVDLVSGKPRWGGEGRGLLAQSTTKNVQGTHVFCG